MNAIAIINEMAKTITINGQVIPIVDIVPNGCEKTNTFEGIIFGFSFWINYRTEYICALDERDVEPKKVLSVKLKNKALEDFENDNAVTINDSLTRETLNKEEKAESIRDENCYIVTDQKTGVQYIVFREHVGYAGMGGITPRLNADGSLCVVDVDGSATEDEITKEVTEDEKTETYE